MLTVFLVVFIDLLGFGIVLPLLPLYVKRYLQPFYFDATTTGLIIGLLYSSFSLMQFIFSPIWGRLSDRIGRRPVLLIGLAGSVVFYGLFGLASALPVEGGADIALVLMTVARAGAGIAGATVATAQAVIADCTPPEKRARGMALIGAAFGIGFTFGPLIAYFGMKLFPNADSGPGYLAALLSLIALVIAIFKLPETLRPGQAPAPRHWLDMRATLEVLRMPGVGLLILTLFLALFGFANFEATLALLNEEVLGFRTDDNYLMFAYVGLVLALAQGGIYRPLTKRISEPTFMGIGVVFMLVGLLGLAWVAAYATPGERGPIYVVLALAVTGFAFLNPSVNALITQRCDPARQGEALGVNQSMGALARILGPACAPALFKSTPDHTRPFLLAAVLLAAVLLLLPRIYRRP
jgi:MFS family permease